MATLHEAAEQRFREITALDEVDDVEVYVAVMNAFTAEAIDDRISRLDG